MLNQDVDVKQPGEAKIYNGDWRRGLAEFPGVLITSSTWQAVQGDGVLGVSLSAIHAAGNRTSFLATAGTAGQIYVLANTVTLSDGQIWKGYGLLRVETEATLLAY